MHHKVPEMLHNSYRCGHCSVGVCSGRVHKDSLLHLVAAGL